jgi:hypothetical protein
MPFLIVFMLALISTGGNIIHSILIGIIGGFLLGLLCFVVQFILRVASMGLPNRDHWLK